MSATAKTLTATKTAGMIPALQARLLPRHRWNQEIYGLMLLGLLDMQSSWLDVGCGHRVLPEGLETLERAIVATPVYAAGCDPDAAAVARHRSLNIIHRCSAYAVPYLDGTFDVVSANMVFEHLPDPEAALREMARVTAPGGHVILHTPNLWNYLVLANKVARVVLPAAWVNRLVSVAERRDEADIYPVCYRANTVARLRQLAALAGLRVTEVRRLTAPKPFFSFFPPLAVLQLIGMRLTRGPLQCFAESMVVVFEKPHAALNPNPGTR
jgi:SAM-dependent methyltransferase